MKLNIETLKKTRYNAKRALKILKLLEEGLSLTEISKRVRCSRQLVEHYHNRLKP